MLLLSVIASIAAGGTAFAAQPSPVVDNPQVRVTITSTPPGGVTPMPGDSTNRILIYLDAGTEQVTYKDGRREKRSFQAGEARWSPAGLERSTENTGGRPFRIVQADLKTPGGPIRFGALDPVRVAPKSYRVVLDNPQARVLHVRIGAKQKVPLHEHALNRIVVYLTDAHMQVTEEGGKMIDTVMKAGEVRFSGTGKHSEENIGAGAVEVVVVEVK
jgi:quercetin dioxygenase-like cupin family protein